VGDKRLLELVFAKDANTVPSLSLSENKKAATPVREKYKWGKIALTWPPNVSGGVAAKTGYDLRIECNALCETIG
jgi:hypothetical protein